VFPVKPECESKGRLLSTAMELIWENSYGSVSVDDICRKAGVKKGSFYHFFPSKSDLTVAAMEADWKSKQPELDAIFSPQLPPLERLEGYAEHSLRCQESKLAAYGKICGCPMITLGAELSTQEENIRLKAAEIVHRYIRYLESAIRDAQAEELIPEGSPRVAAERVFSLFQGALLQAKILNDLGPLRDLKGNFLRLLDVRTEDAFV
jgi:TetR/AcrR family transcriptional repressor of nem operon